jgi:fatty acid desaturase
MALMEKASRTPKKSPVLSLLLLLVAYISFGWFLSDPKFPSFNFHGVSIGVPLILAIGWVLIICCAFISPLSGFSNFVSRWFKSDTVAFLTIFMLAGLAAFILYWLHVFLYILTIIATEALARVDIQMAGLTNWQAFLILLVISLVGLVIGWEARDYLPLMLREYMPMLMPESKEAAFLIGF